jgi:phosphoglycolate phosphatase
MSLQHIIFDLDGTLVDSKFGIFDALSVTMSLSKIPLKYPLDSNLIGPPLMATLSKLTGSIDPKILEPLANEFAYQYDNESYKKTIIYPEINNLLRELSIKNNYLYIVTNKRIVPTIKILELFELKSYFRGVYGIDSFSISNENKSSLLRKVIDKNRIFENAAWYVGDTVGDCLAAQQNFVKFAFVNWGYGSALEFDNVCVKKNILSPGQLLELSS